MAIVGRAFLLAMGGADARIHVENHILRWFTVVNPIDPCSGQIGKDSDVVIAGQQLGLEPSHLADGCCLLGDGMTTNDPSHGWITPEPVGVAYILVAAEASEGGLAKQAGHAVLAVLAGSGVNQAVPSRLGEAAGIIKLSIGDKPGI
jgi:hypothetical protein